MKIRHLVYSIICSCVIVANTVEINPVNVYFIISSRTGERTIEKVFLVKENAVRYCNMYKESHNYFIEEHKLSE